MKTTVIHHSADHDGIFCREITRRFIPDAELIGWDFADLPLEVPEGNIMVMDLPLDAPFGGKSGEFNMGIVNAWEANHLIWIDHHKSAIDSHPPEVGGYRIDGVAACRLAFQWFHNTGPDNPVSDCVLPQKQDFIDRKVEEPMAVQLAGEYDIWDKRNPDAELFQHGLRSQDLSESDWMQLLSFNGMPLVERLLDQGEAVQYAQNKQDGFIAKHRSFDQQFEGLKFMAINAVRCNSLTFESAVRPDHDALLGFYWNGKTWTVSMYHAPHRKDLDLSVIAVKYGGGGHKGACGFTSASLPFDLKPPC